MKNNSKRLLALLCAGCITLSGCGASDTPQNTTDTKTQENTVENTENVENTDFPTETGTDTSSADAIGTDSETLEPTAPITGSSTTDTTMPAAATTTTQEVPKPHITTDSATTENLEEHTVVGIVTDATKYSVAIQVPDGSQYYLTIPDTGVTGNLNYLTIGQLATLKYVGSLDENHASLLDISDSSMITGIYVEEYAFALKIIDACKAMDLEALSDLCQFPVFLETGTYSGAMNTSGEFEAIDNEKIFTEALVTRMANFNLFDLKYTDAGFVMGDGTPSITFDTDDFGILNIIGINCNAEPKKNDTDKDNTK